MDAESSLHKVKEETDKAKFEMTQTGLYIYFSPFLFLLLLSFTRSDPLTPFQSALTANAFRNPLPSIGSSPHHSIGCLPHLQYWR
jgi:hypothetical protein